MKPDINRTSLYAIVFSLGFACDIKIGFEEKVRNLVVGVLVG
jgi:type IV secretory pathway VirB9-like protein